MRKLLLAVFILGLALGWLLSIQSETIFLESPTGHASKEQPSPADYIQEQELFLTDRQLTIQHANLILTKYTNTNSMDPLLDEHSNGIELPYTGQPLQIGDIISYDQDNVR